MRSKRLMQLTPQTATLAIDGKAVKVPVAQVKPGDIFLVKPGDSIPVDGVILEGHSSLNEAALTGESMPVDKAPGDPVSAATINQNGALACRATRVGQDTTLSQVIRLVQGRRRHQGSPGPHPRTGCPASLCPPSSPLRR